VRHSAGAASLYERLCEIYIEAEQTPLLFDSTHKETKIALNSVMKFLEKNQFVLTTEASELDEKIIKLKPLGHSKIDEDIHAFCSLHCTERIIHDDI